MIIGINPEKAPLRKYASAHLRAIKFEELKRDLEARGVTIVHVGDSAIKVSLRGLLLANGSLKNAQIALMEILQILGADSCSIEAEDVAYLEGNTMFSHATSRALESNIPQVEALLSDIPITEDNDGADCVPIFTRLDEAAQFIASDRHPDDAVNDQLRAGAERDLIAHGLLEGGSTYRNWLDDLREEPVAELPKEFQTEGKPWRSAFDKGGD